MQVGDIVKSFDFPGNTECYIVGEVIEVDANDGCFKARTIKQVFGGQVKLVEVGFNDYFRAPLPGQNCFDAFSPGFERVVVVG